ncbi:MULTISPECIES: hypothetical protein [unclassified Staphylococcus]|uniref:hypothetical protein n=1 Tax=unclassified Staphylococcus TaxID=91994 RepID=UPI001AEBE863|nr:MULTISPECIES: hypothetical protein [unclassified Staphylococcus]
MHLNIYGDNIIECERALEIFIEGISLNESNDLMVTWDLKNFICPSVHVVGSKEYIFTLYSGVNKNRWNVDVYSKFLTDKGGLLAEGADALVTVIKNEKEEALVAFEFSNALPAGNNAWQRSGRSLSFSQAKIPYIYVAELGGNELNKDGSVKSMRLPNSTLVLSYILNSIRRQIPNAIVYRISPVATEDTKSKFENIINNHNLQNLSYNIINEIDYDTIIKEIIKNNYEMYRMISKKDERFERKDFINLSKSELESVLINDIKELSIPWKKRLGNRSKYGNKFLNFNDILAQYAISIFSRNSLPFSLLPKEKIESFINDYKSSDNCSKDLLDYLEKNRNDDIVFCLVNGFKPGGEDSRPDRGLIPFVRMLMGDETLVITVVFGPVPEYHMNAFKNKDYNKIMSSNGLFSSIMGQSNYTLILSPEEKEEAFSSENVVKVEKKQMKYDTISKMPKVFTEMDVDTVIHLLFTKKFNSVFESFCNPPGGDWSGISLIQNNIEYRWLSLERAPKDMKRPDHVLQFIKEVPNVILSIESKDNKSSLIKSEKEVGPKMIKYLYNLKNKNVNAERYFSTSGIYTQSVKKISKENFEYKTGVAYIEKDMNYLNRNEFIKIKDNCEVDFVLAFKFVKIKDEVEVNLYYYCEDISMNNILFNKLSELNYSFENLRIHQIK